MVVFFCPPPLYVDLASGTATHGAAKLLEDVPPTTFHLGLG